jgi:hypothetical protein
MVIYKVPFGDGYARRSCQMLIMVHFDEVRSLVAEMTSDRAMLALATASFREADLSDCSLERGYV